MFGDHQDRADPQARRVNLRPLLHGMAATPDTNPIVQGQPVRFDETSAPEPISRAQLFAVTDEELRRASATSTDPASRPTQTESTPDWDALAPRGVYARIARPIFLGGLVLLGLPFALVLAAIVAPINALVFRSARRVFFLQPRVGHRGRVFLIWKFRTMREAQRDAHDSWSSGEDVLRVTRFGRFLRSSHLDELPQVWNVLRGDMDLIGPRPEMIEIEAWASAHVPGFGERLVIRPGLTGLAQITQGYTQNDTAAYTEKLRINREYLRTLSLAGDVRVVLRTVAWMLRGRGWTNFRGRSSARSVSSSADRRAA